MSKEHEEHIDTVKAFDALVRSMGLEQMLFGISDELGSIQDKDIAFDLEEVAKQVGRAAAELKKYKKENPDYDDKKVANPI